MSEKTTGIKNKCRRCDKPAVFITVAGYLCSKHALSEMRTDPDWVPLICTDLKVRKNHSLDLQVSSVTMPIRQLRLEPRFTSATAKNPGSRLFPTRGSTVCGPAPGSGRLRAWLAFSPKLDILPAVSRDGLQR